MAFCLKTIGLFNWLKCHLINWFNSYHRWKVIIYIQQLNFSLCTLLSSPFTISILESFMSFEERGKLQPQAKHFTEMIVLNMNLISHYYRCGEWQVTLKSKDERGKSSEHHRGWVEWRALQPFGGGWDICASCLQKKIKQWYLILYWILSFFSSRSL